jgi:hypothetical protein
MTKSEGSVADAITDSEDRWMTDAITARLWLRQAEPALRRRCLNQERADV